MQIAMYTGHHGLPFWRGKEQPKEFFNPEVHGKMRMYFGKDPVPVAETWIWGILMGIHLIDMPLVLGHISALCPCSGADKLHFPKRVWVQFSTHPKEMAGSVPKIFDEQGKVLVEGLWGGDNGTYSPYDWVKGEGGGKTLPIEFWQNFFTKALKEQKTEELRTAAEDELKAAEENKRIQLVYSAIPD